MSIIHHLKEQPFVVATGLAALIHSTWSLGTMFAGPQPPVENISSLIEFVHFAGWLIPAFLIAFALDVGQIATSHEIRVHGRSFMRMLTFGVFAVATYYLQWIYLINHIPAMTLSAGIAESHRQAAQTMSDLAIWLFPMLLPLSTLLYTFSGREDAHLDVIAPVSLSVQKPSKTVQNGALQGATKNAQRALPEAPEAPESVPAEDPEALLPGTDEGVTIWCTDCGWSTTKDSTESAQRALRTHKSLHCSALALVEDEAPVIVSNGNGKH